MSAGRVALMELAPTPSCKCDNLLTAYPVHAHVSTGYAPAVCIVKNTSSSVVSGFRCVIRAIMVVEHEAPAIPVAFGVGQFLAQLRCPLRALTPNLHPHRRLFGDAAAQYIATLAVALPYLSTCSVAIRGKIMEMMITWSIALGKRRGGIRSCCGCPAAPRRLH